MNCSLGISNFLKEISSLPILLFPSISLHWSLRKAFLSLIAILWNSAFRCVYLSFSPLPFVSLLSSAICKGSSATATATAAKSLQLCPTLCDPRDSSLSGSPIPGILQASILEWVAISFSNAWKWKVKVKLLSCVWHFVTPWTAAYQALPSMGFSRQEYWSGVPLPSLKGSSDNHFAFCYFFLGYGFDHRLLYNVMNLLP